MKPLSYEEIVGTRFGQPILGWFVAGFRKGQPSLTCGLVFSILSDVWDASKSQSKPTPQRVRGASKSCLCHVSLIIGRRNIRLVHLRHGDRRTAFCVG
jgi:hypothetical protein